ncbi:MAG: hypothetical protein ABW133_16065 [Polyangiaceae bacterium]
MKRAAIIAVLTLASCGGSAKTDSRYPERPKGCAVQVFHGKVVGIQYDGIGHVDAICGSDLGEAACIAELKDQTCKLGGDLVYDVPDDPEKPSPDKIKFTGRAAHTRAASPAPAGSTTKK